MNIAEITYGSIAQAITTPRQFRELLQMLRETSEVDIQEIKVESVESTTTVQPITKVPLKQAVKPDTHSPTHGIDESI